MVVAEKNTQFTVFKTLNQAEEPMKKTVTTAVSDCYHVLVSEKVQAM
jgi:hypothetical protein